MPETIDAVAFHLTQLRAGEFEAAYHGLLDLDGAAAPLLIAAFSAFDDSATRAILVEVVWQSRRPDMIGFLGATLFDRSPDVWKQALDGLVAISGPHAVREIRAALAKVQLQSADNGLTVDWLQEALDQVNDSAVASEGA